MTRTLILIRHCKSDWDASSASDHDRPLNGRGQRDAPRIGAWLVDQGLMPDVCLCSDAVRTQQTWHGMATEFPAPHTAELTLTRDLYLAEPETMLRLIRAQSAQTITLVAHSPGIPSLAWKIVDMPPIEPEFGTYPTGAVTVIDFDVAEWSEMTEGTVRAFVTPKSLPV